jgi:hypothetical protein
MKDKKMHQKHKNKILVNLMIKNTLRNNQYFIHVANILHKVLDALRCSRLILIQKSQLS